MYLKSLELFGFKTFADRTSLEFGPGVTGIVGPNGSGKSNIADALLFVLGEQANKPIRVNQLTDVIFNGNEQRKAVGLAEVTLVLDNSDRILSLPYQEVAITRRTHRSAESDYFINRTRCRLRDIQELFLDTGLGRGAYSQIGQNEVDRILSLRPEDRRALFEEAAGTAKYRGRRTEALRKLEQTQSHLTRIHDIHAEVAAQLEPLATQAAQAREYRTLVEQHRGLAVSVLVAEASQARQMIGRCEHEVFVVRSDLDRLTVEAEQLESRAQELRVQEEAVERDLEASRRRSGLAQASASKAEAEIAVARERLHSCRSQRSVIERDADGLGERTRALGERIAAHKEAVTREAERKAELEAGEPELAQELERVQAEFDALASSLAALSTQKQDAAAKRATLETELASLRGQRRETDDRLRENDQFIQRLAAQEKQEGEREIAAQQELEELAQAEQELSEALDAARQRDAELQALLSEQMAQLSTASAAVGSAEARVASLEELEKAGGHLPRGVRAVLAARQDGRLSGIVGTVSDVIGTPPEYQRAISAALGEWSKALVMESSERAWAAVRWLQAERGGYAVLLPLRGLTASAPPSVPEAALTVEGATGRAVDLVSFHPRRRALVERLLGGTLVVADLDAAQRARGAMTEAGTIVTLLGERWDADGVVGGGSEPAAADDPLSLASALGRASDDVDAATGARAELEEAVAATRTLLDEARAAAQDVEARYRHCVAGIQKSGTRVAVTAERLEGIRAQRELREGERNRLAVALGELDRRIAARAEKLEEIAVAPPTAVGDEARLPELASECDRLRGRLADLRLDLRALTAGIREAERELEHLPQELAVCQERLVATADELSKLDDAERQATELVATSASELSGAKERVQEALDEIRTFSDRRHELAKSIEDAGRLSRDARGRMPQLQESLSAHEIRRARAEEARQSIETRLSEEFEMTAAQAEAAAKDIADLSEARATLKSLRVRLAQMGAVNTGAEAEWERLAERERFLAEQKADLERARDNLREIIAEIDNATKVQFLEAFNAISEEFQRVFRYFFDGGQTQLVLTDPDNLLETGIDIVVRPPGRARQTLASLSGGERALTAISLLFAMLRVRPSPFCMLDEIDAALDEPNTVRLARLLRDWTDQTQFIVVTHAPGTMQGCDRLYGVTMQDMGVSCCLSISLEDAEDVIEGRPAKSAKEVLFARRAQPEETATSGQ